MSLRFPSFGWGDNNHGAHNSFGQLPKSQPLPVEIQLGSNSVRLTQDGWKLDSTELSKTHEKCQRLEEEVLQLRRDLEASRTETKESAEQANMATFQNQLLLDMLAVARLDEGNFKTRLAQETARHAELSQSLEQAYAKIAGAGLELDASDAP